ncbi:unnamed protein product [Caenorhabditis auriculariae]|uniref:TIL domain-containing protein n=1 Tax=Caenorhabditis auriculariae TaxID=2777116 RepID=A0A8S1HD75_9PELO|nr:unnamed protein product [Caenorhabditis auriculariae]
MLAATILSIFSLATAQFALPNQFGASGMSSNPWMGMFGGQQQGLSTLGRLYGLAGSQGGSQLPRLPSNIANLPIGTAIQNGIFGINQCTANETLVSCGSECEPRCTTSLTSQPVQNCLQSCVPNVCQCNTGYVRSYDGSRCVLARDCLATLSNNCMMVGTTRICFPGAQCGSTYCPSGWSCSNPQFCFGASCQPSCVPNFGTVNLYNPRSGFF